MFILMRYYSKTYKCTVQRASIGCVWVPSASLQAYRARNVPFFPLCIRNRIFIKFHCIIVQRIEYVIFLCVSWALSLFPSIQSLSVLRRFFKSFPFCVCHAHYPSLPPLSSTRIEACHFAVDRIRSSLAVRS